MPDIRSAVGAVIDYVGEMADLFPRAAMRLEEFEFDSEKSEWLLTFSFDEAFTPRRIYRVFRVSNGGEVLAMKIREPDLAA